MTQTKEDRAAYKKAWIETNPEKDKEHQKRYREANKEKRAASYKAWYEANKEKKAAYSQAWREANKGYDEAWYEVNKEKKAAKSKAYREANPEKFNALYAKRRAAKIQRTPAWLTKEHLEDIELTYSHSRQLQELTGVAYHVDHIVPLQGESISGLHVPWNLQVITATENMSKSNKWEDQVA